MDMTIAPALGELDRERLRKAGRVNGDPVLLAVITAALRIDDARSGEAQLLLLDAVNGFTADGVRIPAEAHALVDAVRKGLTGHAYQTCTLRSCLDLVDAMRLGCTPTSAGERIGRLQQALAQLIAARGARRRAA